MGDYESGAAAISAPATPGTPTPLMPTSFRVDSLSYDRKSMPRCKCLPVDAPTWGAPHTCLTDFAVPDISLTRKLGAEFVGTFILIFAATAGPIVNQKYNGVESLIGNAACAGLAVMIVILSTGHISGAHLNPSLTIAFAALRHFPWVQVPAYIAAQVSASICASFALKGVFHPFLSGGVTVPSVSNGQAFALEFLITFNLLFVVTAVATDTRAVGELAGIAVGATVMLNILVAGPSSGGSMNPVRTLGPAVAAGNYKAIWIYLVAPTLGAIAGAGIYTLVKLRGDEEEQPRPVRSFRR
ncbi:NOD26-like intrinsic protein 5 [Perilla frutescens var. hirtella]|uniref:NOD26-like intrinsic protein 5 n=1 Tax=Perilla frutescens var. hirtella TaxID=608512 RepID=A0AAD4PCJ0_PERFH|nr:NOD26-like intrinsic protein 5 [Perilla frutescens var. hirtella]KAH6810159.1 NOD26-like intrinsic protein 5 [Perilla frutescens var. frutescens]KAH6833832.1 NOD26-like intrinsic protein 5 [Perilla frutescens var. hirtella]